MEHAPDTTRERGGWDDLLGVVERCSKPGIQHDRAELWELRNRINAEGDLWFIRESGQVTEEPWFVKDIVPVNVRDANGREDTVIYILVAPRKMPQLEEQYALGEFFSKRIIGPRRLTRKTT